MVRKEFLFVQRIINCLMKMEIIKIIHQPFAMKLPNGKIQKVCNAGQVK